MPKAVIAAAAIALALAARPARADFSACAAAYAAKDPGRQIELYTTCLKHGGLVSTDVAGAFTNRGVAYVHVGESDKALQDFTWAIQYDPRWPVAYADRASVEAGQGKCAEALTDIDGALKLAPHRKEYLELKARLVAGCPIVSKAPG